MPAREVFTAAPAVRSYELDSEMILFNGASGRIVVLNETAAFVWEGLAQGLDSVEIVEEISQQTGAERDQVLADCQALIDQWTDAGLGTIGAESEAGLAIEPETEGQPELEAEAQAALEADDVDRKSAFRAARREAELRRRYRIADLRLNLDAPYDAFGVIGGLLDHCAIPGEARIENGEVPSQDDGSATLTIARRDGDWLLFLEDILLARCDDDTKLAPMIHATTLHLSYAASKSRLSIHGAAVFAGDQCVLLPGRPGAGKSTLTAALVNAGFGYCTDDFVMLDGNPLRLRGVPLCVGLKQGAWPLLEGSIPAVGSLPTRLREDGQQVRYLAPPVERIAASDDRFRVTAIVFPRVAQNEPARLAPLPRSTALLRIADAGYHLLGELDVKTFEAMLAWLESLDCYELSYSDLDDGVGCISGLLSTDAVAGGSPSLLQRDRDGI